MFPQTFVLSVAIRRVRSMPQGLEDNRIESMRRIMPVLFFLASTFPASAAEPLGEWVVANGNARIKIDKCGDNHWGVNSW
jgi:hypothetical protein